VSTVLPTVIYELGLTGTAVAQLMTMVSSISPVLLSFFWIVFFRTRRFRSLQAH